MPGMTNACFQRRVRSGLAGWTFCLAAALHAAPLPAQLEVTAQAQAPSLGLAAPVSAASDPAAAWDATPSPAAAELLRWIAHTGNNQGRPYVVVDKAQAHVWVLDAQHRPRAHSGALLGIARGDHEVADIRSRDVRFLPASARITPAGRFLSEPGINLQGEEVVWLDYEAGLAMHRLRPGMSQFSRLKRLLGGVASEQRVSLGCVVLPVAFYTAQIQPLLGRAPGVVYVLPENEALSAWLPRWDQAAQAAL